MELSPTNTASTKSPEPENETHFRIRPSKITSINGSSQHRKLVSFPGAVSYKECLKNHAACLGGHALDGCGEYMNAPAANPSDPSSFKCSACGCHRNFHRREPEEAQPTSAVIEYQPHHRHHPPPPSPPPISSAYYPRHMVIPLANHRPDNTSPVGIEGINLNPNAKKRFRTKFSQTQKEKMQEFAEKIGWKLQKINEEDVQQFCHEIGVERGVLKVWMHNNKNSRKIDNNNHLNHHEIAVVVANGSSSSS